MSDLPYNMIPASITQNISSNGDTIYTEIPETERFALRRIVPATERRASTKNPKGNEYEILKRRFQEALNVSDPNKIHWFYGK